MSHSPTVTTIVTVYNEKEWISTAINSLLGQTFSDLELLIVDDGSDDGTAAILDEFSDPRIRVIHAERMGRAAALALAVSEARGAFIANLDADDECYPERIEQQVEFLVRHRDHGWVGGAEDREDTQRGEHYIRYYPESDAEIRRMAVKCIPYCHSAVMFRAAIIQRGLTYDPQQPFLIDFEFFVRVARISKVANLPVPVVKRRAREKSYFQRTFTNSQQNRELCRLCRRARRDFGLPFWMEVYPASRSLYPLLPNFVKGAARKLLGLREIGPH